MFSLVILGVPIVVNLFNWFFAKKPIESPLILKAATIILLVLGFIWLLVLGMIILNYFILAGQAYKKQAAFKGIFKSVINDKSWSYVHEYNDGISDLVVEGEINWDIMTRKVENDEFIFLYINRLSYIFPKASFNSEEDLNAFKQMLDRKTNIKLKSYK